MGNNGFRSVIVLAITLLRWLSVGECTQIRSSAAFVGDLFVMSCDSNASDPTLGRLLQSPNLVTSSQAQTTVSHNSSSAATQVVDWFYRSSPDLIQMTPLSSDGRVLANYASRYSVDTTIRHKTNLVIHNVQLDDAGEYSCQRNGISTVVARLSVFDYARREPKTTVSAFVGDDVALQCITGEPPVDWWYERSETEQAKLVCSVGNIIDGYVRRFSLDTAYRSHFNLIIRDLEATDNGVYTCIDKGGFGSRIITRLNVFHAEQDAVKLTRIGSIGNTILMPCVTNMSSASGWLFQSTPQSRLHRISLAAVVSHTFRSRFHLDMEREGHYNLVVDDAAAIDSGVYICREDAGAMRDTYHVILEITDVAGERKPATLQTTSVKSATATTPSVVIVGERKPSALPTPSAKVTEAISPLPVLSESTSSSLKTAMIVFGIVIGTVLAIILIILVVYFCCRRKSNRNLNAPLDPNKSYVQPLLDTTVYPSSPAKEHSAVDTSLAVGRNEPIITLSPKTKCQRKKSAPASSSEEVLDATIKCYSEFIDALKQLNNPTTSGISSQSLDNLAGYFARNFDLLDVLRKSDYLSYDELRRIEKEGQRKDMATFVDIIAKRSADDLRNMATFCQQHNRDDAAQLLTEVIHERRSSISMGLPLLRYILETRFHFRQRLCEHKVLTEDEASVVLFNPTAYEQSDQILHYLNQKSDDMHQEFIKVLEETCQSHVVKYMQRCDASAVGDDRPLGLPELLLITENFKKLVGLMRPSPAFIDSLDKEKYVTYEQKRYIEKSHEFDQKNQKLLDMLTRRSVADFKKFITLLRNNEQTEAADILSGISR